MSLLVVTFLYHISHVLTLKQTIKEFKARTLALHHVVVIRTPWNPLEWRILTHLPKSPPNLRSQKIWEAFLLTHCSNLPYSPSHKSWETFLLCFVLFSFLSFFAGTYLKFNCNNKTKKKQKPWENQRKPRENKVDSAYLLSHIKKIWLTIIYYVTNGKILERNNSLEARIETGHWCDHTLTMGTSLGHDHSICSYTCT